MVLTLLYTLVFVGAINTLVAAALPVELRDQAQLGLTFPMPAAAAGLLVVAGFVFGTVVFLAATRALSRDPAERASLSADLFTRRMGRAVVSAIGANVVVSVAVLVGFVFLVIPGVFLAVSFVFVAFAIGVEDERALDALRRSWGLASGNRWRLLALGIVVGVGTGLLGGVGSLVSVVNPTAGQILSLVVAAPASILGYGILADAYVQLRDAHEAEDET